MADDVSSDDAGVVRRGIAGGHVASKAAVVYPPDGLILLSSLPDTIEVPLLRELQVATTTGWKVLTFAL